MTVRGDLKKVNENATQVTRVNKCLCVFFIAQALNLSRKKDLKVKKFNTSAISSTSFQDLSVRCI